MMMTVIERASAIDLMQRSSDAGSVPNQVGGVIVLDAAEGVDVAAVRQLVAERLAAIPRLRQRLAVTPLGCGRPVWLDDPSFDVTRHVTILACPAPGDERALLDLVAATVTTPLPATRPCWSATLVTDLQGGRLAVLLLFHHVLADGIGGLALLAGLVDGAPRAVACEPLGRSPPSRASLRRDANVQRRAALRRLPATLRQVRAAWQELSGERFVTAPRCSLNRPTGPRRTLALARADLAAARSVAHASHASVNDVALTAIIGALRALLQSRGEPVDRLVISVPVASRARATATELGNQVGVLAVSLPSGGEPLQRLRTVAAITRRRRRGVRGSSAALLAPTFRLFGLIGVLGWLIEHQRHVNSFVTNLRGPDRTVTIADLPVTDAFVVPLATGNVTVAFAILSYHGALTVTVVADAGVDDLDTLVAALQREFDRLGVGSP